MDKILMLAAAFILFASVASAESIAGKFGFSLMGGTKVSLDLDDNDHNWGYAVGGGFVYGITDSVAIDFDVQYAENRLTDHRLKDTLARRVDLALGMQYRFFPTKRLVPYLGAGASIIIPDITITEEFANFLSVGTATDTAATFGGFAQIGLDYFVTPQIALYTEFKETLGVDSDIKANGKTIAVYDPSNFSAMLGARLFF